MYFIRDQTTNTEFCFIDFIQEQNDSIDMNLELLLLIESDKSVLTDM